MVTLIKESAEITDTKTEIEITKGITLLSLEASSSENKSQILIKRNNNEKNGLHKINTWDETGIHENNRLN